MRLLCFGSYPDEKSPEQCGKSGKARKQKKKFFAFARKKSPQNGLPTKALNTVPVDEAALKRHIDFNGSCEYVDSSMTSDYSARIVKPNTYVRPATRPEPGINNYGKKDAGIQSPRSLEPLQSPQRLVVVNGIVSSDSQRSVYDLMLEDSVKTCELLQRNLDNYIYRVSHSPSPAIGGHEK